jgi:hypothetical protein
MKIIKQLLNNFQFWLADNQHNIEQGVFETAMSGRMPVKTTEPQKRPSSRLAWVRWMQRYNKTIIQL